MMGIHSETNKLIKAIIQINKKREQNMQVFIYKYTFTHTHQGNNSVHF